MHQIANSCSIAKLLVQENKYIVKNMKYILTCFIKICWLVPYNTLHKGINPSLFCTRGKLILDIDIASYSITCFFYSIFIFILQVKTWLETIQGAPHPHQTAGNIGNGNPLRSVSPRSQQAGYGKILAIDPTEANMGLFPPSFFTIFFSTRTALNLSRPITHSSNRLHMAPPPKRCRPQRPPRINIRTLIIWDILGFRLVQAIWAVERGFSDMILLTKKKIQSDMYSYNPLGYNLNFLTEYTFRSRGFEDVVRLVTRERPVRWEIDFTHYHGPIVVSCEIVPGITQTPLVRAYLPPSALEHPPDREEARQLFRDPLSLGTWTWTSTKQGDCGSNACWTSSQSTLS